MLEALKQAPNFSVLTQSFIQIDASQHGFFTFRATGGQACSEGRVIIELFE